MSSLSRAFTTRRPSKKADGSLPERSLTTKNSRGSNLNLRAKISAPVTLLSTTNMLSYNAPDLFPTQSAADDSDSAPSTTASTLTSPVQSLIGSVPSSPEPSHHSGDFGDYALKSLSTDDAPKIPQRAPSHTKRNVELAHSRSRSKMSTSSGSHKSIGSHKSTSSHVSQGSHVSLTSSQSIGRSRSSIQMFERSVDAAQEEPHPFGKELAQVTELAEELGCHTDKLPHVEKEEQELVTKGLFKFSAEDYLSEISGLFMMAFGDHTPKPSVSALWI